MTIPVVPWVHQELSALPSQGGEEGCIEPSKNAALREVYLLPYTNDEQLL